jgi:hypothetical protein
MSRRPVARVRVLSLPHLHPEAVRVEVDCRAPATGITQIPALGGPELPTPALITAATFEHDARCGECDTSEVHAQGATGLLEETERLHVQAQQRWFRRYAHGRRK